MPRALAGLLLALALALAPAPAPAAATAALAGPQPVRSQRELAVEARGFVLAAPLDPARPTRFRVLQTFRGVARPGDVLTPNLGAYKVVTFDPPVPPEKVPTPRLVSVALLFLADDGKSPELVRAGLRFGTEDGRVLVPSVDLGTSGLFSMEVNPSIDWPTVLFYARQDAEEVERFAAISRLRRPAARAAAWLGWLERHRGEVGLVGRPEEDGEVRAGWGRFDHLAFQGVFNCGDLETVWRGIQAYAATYPGDRPVLDPATFGSRAGREFLLARSAEESALAGDRTRALDYLAEALRRGEPTTEERTALETALLKLLPASPSAAFRISLVRALGKCSPAPDRILPRLVEAYQAEPTGPGREALAEVVCDLAPPARWQELTGNPPGVLACLRDLDHDAEKGRFWLSYRRGGPPVLEAPTLHLERLGPLGIPVEAKTFPVTPLNTPMIWSEGWVGKEYLLVEFPLKGLQAGTWRARVQGTAGKEKARWTSEPRRLVLTPPPRPR